MKLSQHISKPLMLACYLSFCLSAANAQSDFTTEQPFELSLYIDFQRFVDQMDDPKYVPAKVEYVNSEGKQLSKKVKVKARGAFRRKSCEIPPIRISFNDDDYEVDLFNNLGKVKLVNECQFGQQNQEYLVKEYLTYKIYQTLSDYSLNTWFMHIKFIDSQDTTNHFSSYSFLIEDIDDLAARHGAKEIETMDLEHSDLDPWSESVVMLFSYMISNLDLYVGNLHNLKLLSPADTTVKPILVPYDFDFCGLVNADYAYTSEDLPGKTVRYRYYLGECRTNEEYESLFQSFIDRKTEIFSLFRECDLLSSEAQDDAVQYLEEFYQIIENPRLARRKIKKACW